MESQVQTGPMALRRKNPPKSISRINNHLYLMGFANMGLLTAVQQGPDVALAWASEAAAAGGYRAYRTDTPAELAGPPSTGVLVVATVLA